MAQLKGLTDESITKLLAKDANELVRRLLQGIVVNDDLDTGDETDYRSIPDETDHDTEHETDGEDANNATIIEASKSDDDPKPGYSKQIENQNKICPKNPFKNKVLKKRCHTVQILQKWEEQ